MKDWLGKIKLDYGFGILIWEKTNLESQYRQHGSKLREFFPELPKLPEPVQMYKITPGQYSIGCDEFDEIEIHVYNSSDAKVAMARAKEFVEFIKANEFCFD